MTRGRAVTVEFSAEVYQRLLDAGMPRVRYLEYDSSTNPSYDCFSDPYSADLVAMCMFRWLIDRLEFTGNKADDLQSAWAIFDAVGRAAYGNWERILPLAEKS